MPSRIFNLPFASAATGTSNPAVYIGPNARCHIVVSNVTAWNAGAGNTTIKLYGTAGQTIFTTVIGTSVSAAFWPIQSMTIATEVSGGMYGMPYPCGPWVKVGFGTAPTGGTANGHIDVVVETDGY